MGIYTGGGITTYTKDRPPDAAWNRIENLFPDYNSALHQMVWVGYFRWNERIDKLEAVHTRGKAGVSSEDKYYVGGMQIEPKITLPSSFESEIPVGMFLVQFNTTQEIIGRRVVWVNSIPDTPTNKIKTPNQVEISRAPLQLGVGNIFYPARIRNGMSVLFLLQPWSGSFGKARMNVFFDASLIRAPKPITEPDDDDDDDDEDEENPKPPVDDPDLPVIPKNTLPNSTPFTLVNAKEPFDWTDEMSPIVRTEFWGGKEPV